MDFALPAPIEALRNQARDLVAQRLAPQVEIWENRGYFPRAELMGPLAELGVFGALIPKQYGGSGLGWLAAVVLSEELARGSSSLGLQITLSVLGCARIIARFGTPAAKERYLPRLARGEYLGGFALAEPGAGADLAALKTTAEACEQGYRLSGRKEWVSNAGQADCLVCYALTERAAGPRGLSAFVLEPRGNPGVSVSKQGSLGHGSLPLGRLELTGALVPAQNLLGRPGQGARIAQRAAQHTRLTAAASAVGLAAACLEQATGYAAKRRQFGRPVGRFQMIQDQVAQMAVEIEAARLLVYKAAWQADAGRPPDEQAVARAKYKAAWAANLCANHALRILGAYGYASYSHVARMYRDAPAYLMLEGSANLCKLLVARQVLGLAGEGG